MLNLTQTICSIWRRPVGRPALFIVPALSLLCGNAWADNSAAVQALCQAYQNNYIAQRSLPASATPDQRMALTMKSYAAANATLASTVNQQFDAMYKAEAANSKAMSKYVAEQDRRREELGIDPPPGTGHKLTADEQAARKAKILEAMQHGKLKGLVGRPGKGVAVAKAKTGVVKTGPVTAAKKGTGRDSAAEAGGAEGAKSVSFKGSGPATPTNPGADVGGADQVSFGASSPAASGKK